MRQYRPLRGTRVLTLEAAFALPACTRTLADLGAEVIRIGPPSPREGRSPVDRLLDNQDVLLNKSCLSVNLAHEEGRAIVRDLIPRVDVVCNNFRPRVMAKYGLGYQEVARINPQAIVLQLSGYGTPGPWQDFPAFGPSVEAAAGMNALVGDSTYPPMRIGSDIYADQGAARYAVLAIIAALEHRRRTGQGQYIDLSMYEAMVHLIGETVLYAARHGRSPARLGNRHPAIAPQGVYPCRGHDEWVAISVVRDEHWHALRSLLDDVRLLDPALDTVEERHRHHNRIDAAISDWTRQRRKEDAAQLLQDRGIPAGPVQRPPDIPFDPQYVHRRFLRTVHHRQSILGRREHPHISLGWRVNGFDRPILRDAKGDGADNRPLLRRLLGLTGAEVSRLEKIGALRPPRPVFVSDDEPET